MTAPPEVLLPPTRNIGTALIAVFAALIVAAFAVLLFADPVLTLPARVVVALLSALFLVTLTSVAVTLVRGHGSLLLDAPGARLGFGITSATDVWWLPFADLHGLRLIPIASPDDATVARWLLVLCPTNRPEIVLAESSDRALIQGICDRLAAHIGLPSDAPAEPPPPAYPGRVTTSVRKGALQGLLLSFGLSLAIFGILAFTRVDTEPVVGFIFAPVLIIMGLVLAAVPIVKRLADETLSFDGLRWRHGFNIGRYHWGVRALTSSSPQFRLRLLGMRGAYLELLGDHTALIIGAGSTTKSTLSLDALSRIPSRFTTPPPPSERRSDPNHEPLHDPTPSK